MIEMNNIKFTEKEFKEMNVIKNNHSMGWHDLIYHAIIAYDLKT